MSRTESTTALAKSCCVDVLLLCMFACGRGRPEAQSWAGKSKLASRIASCGDTDHKKCGHEFGRGRVFGAMLVVEALCIVAHEPFKCIPPATTIPNNSSCLFVDRHLKIQKRHAHYHSKFLHSFDRLCGTISAAGRRPCIAFDSVRRDLRDLWRQSVPHCWLLARGGFPRRARHRQLLLWLRPGRARVAEYAFDGGAEIPSGKFAFFSQQPPTKSISKWWGGVFHRERRKAKSGSLSPPTSTCIPTVCRARLSRG